MVTILQILIRYDTAAISQCISLPQQKRDLYYVRNVHNFLCEGGGGLPHMIGELDYFCGAARGSLCVVICTQ